MITDTSGNGDHTLLPEKLAYLEYPDASARGGRGSTPPAMLTSDRDTFRCQNWINDPENPNGE